MSKTSYDGEFGVGGSAFDGGTGAFGSGGSAFGGGDDGFGGDSNGFNSGGSAAYHAEYGYPSTIIFLIFLKKNGFYK
eukprot:SAG31_NODE_32382_length_356_cov_1.408560_1_plen_77_part_00